MLFIVIGLIFGFIILIAFTGDYKTKEIEKHKQEWENLFGNRYR